MLICQCNAMHRRDVMCGGGAAVFSAIIATLMGSSKPVKAEAISGAVPELDSVAVRVVVDSYQFAVAPSRKLTDVDIQHFGWGVSGDKPPGRTLVSEFGLSMHAETRRGTETRNVLMDFGFTPEAVINNTNLLGVDPARARCSRAQSRSLRSFWRSRRLPASKQRQTKAQTADLYWR